MTTHHSPAPPGFHEGELVVQQLAGVRAAASRLRAMLDPADVSSGVGRFLASQNLAILSARDHDGLLWTSPLTGAAGFLKATDPNTLRVHTTPSPGDPLHHLDAGQPVGLLVIDFTKRRRYRINGWLAATGQGDGAGLTIKADQAYGNCPQYIQQRDLAHDTGGSTGPTTARRQPPTTHSCRRTTSPRSPPRTPSSSAPPTRSMATTPRTAEARLASSGSINTLTCHGRTSPATTCSTASATSPSTRPPPCCSATSPPDAPSTFPAPPAWNTEAAGSPATTAAPAAASPSPSSAPAPEPPLPLRAAHTAGQSRNPTLTA